jgi:hypothetical protein
MGNNFFSQCGLDGYQKTQNPRIKISVCTQGAPSVVMKIFILELLFLGAFFSLRLDYVRLDIFEIYVKFCVF